MEIKDRLKEMFQTDETNIECKECGVSGNQILCSDCKLVHKFRYTKSGKKDIPPLPEPIDDMKESVAKKVLCEYSKIEGFGNKHGKIYGDPHEVPKFWNSVEWENANEVSWTHFVRPSRLKKNQVLCLIKSFLIY